jgi:hypothetical protein
LRTWTVKDVEKALLEKLQGHLYLLDLGAYVTSDNDRGGGVSWVEEGAGCNMRWGKLSG